MIKVALTHDIDRINKSYQFLTKPAMALFQGRLNDFYSSLRTVFIKNNYWTFPDIIGIESEYGVRSTFFFLNESIRFKVLKPWTFTLAFGRYNIIEPKIINIIKWLDENGWEIGVHGSFNSFHNIDLLKHEKKVLESILGHDVIGIRQHYLNLNSETWMLQNQSVFKYDSSYGSNTKIGFIDGKIAPFHPLDNDFTVFPQVIMDTCFMENRNRWSVFEQILDICEKENSVLVINFHNHVFNEADYPGFRKTYIKIIEIIKDRDSQFGTLAEHFMSLHLSSKDYNS